MQFAPYYPVRPSAPLSSIRFVEGARSTTHFARIIPAFDDRWSEMLRTSDLIGRKVWNSEMYQLENLSMSRGTLVRASVMEAREVMVAREWFMENPDAAKTTPLFHLWVSCLTRTSCGRFVFGFRSTTTMNAGFYGPAGGGLSKSEQIVTGGADIEKVLYGELVEELGIAREHVQSIEWFGMLTLPRHGAGFTCLTQLTASREEVEDLFEGRTTDEMSHIRIVNPGELAEFLASGQVLVGKEFGDLVRASGVLG